MTTVTYRSLDTDTAVRMAQEALRHARTLNIKVSIAVVGRDGHLLAALREAGAPFHSVSIAADKAYTAASFGAPTGKLGDVLHGMGPVVFHGLLERSQLAAFGGGLPIRQDGEIIGGIGVSGGTAEQDEACAQAALQQL